MLVAPLLLAAAPSIAAGAANVFGGISQNKANQREATKARKFNAAEALKNRQFQERMSNSSYQRAVADMRLSGINPMLAFQQGGASSPSGSAAQGPSARMENVISPAVSSAMGATRLRKDLQAIDAQIGLTNQNTETAAAQADKMRAEATESTARTRLIGARVGPASVRDAIAQDILELKDEGSSAISTGAAWARRSIARFWGDEKVAPVKRPPRAPRLEGFRPRPKG